MNIPQVQPPKRAHGGGKPRLTPMQQVELWSWHCAKRYLGSAKTKAREMGVSLSTLKCALDRMKKRERDQVER